MLDIGARLMDGWYKDVGTELDEHVELEVDLAPRPYVD